MTSPVAMSATATPVPCPLKPCEASARAMPLASAASCAVRCAEALRCLDADREQAEHEQCGAQSPHQRNVMVMVWVPYTDARSLGIQMSIVAPITAEPVSAATHGP